MKKKAELLKAINEKRLNVLNLLKEGKVDEAQKASVELDEMSKQYDKMPDDVPVKGVVNKMDKKEKLVAVRKAVDAFLHKGWNGMTDEQKQLVKPVNSTDSTGQVESGSGRGAALVPVFTADFVKTMPSGVYRLRDRVFDYPVNTKSGKIPKVANPSDTLTNFDELPSGGMNKTHVSITSIDFNVADYGDIVPISNDLLADELASVYDVIIDCFAKKMRNTENKLILDAIDGAVVASSIHTWKEIIEAINACDPVDGDKVIVTNTDGGSFLANQTDNNHYLLVQPDVTKPNNKYFRGYEVIQLPMSALPNDQATDAIPFYVGSLYDAICFVERQGLVVTVNPYGDAFAQNGTDVRITARLDCKPAFTGAVKKLLYTPPSD